MSTDKTDGHAHVVKLLPRSAGFPAALTLAGCAIAYSGVFDGHPSRKIFPHPIWLFINRSETPGYRVSYFVETRIQNLASEIQQTQLVENSILAVLWHGEGVVVVDRHTFTFSLHHTTLESLVERGYEESAFLRSDALE